MLAASLLPVSTSSILPSTTQHNKPKQYVCTHTARPTATHLGGILALAVLPVTLASDIVVNHSPWLGEERLPPNLRVHRPRVELVKVLRQNAEALHRLVIAVEPEAGIAGVVVPRVEVLFTAVTLSETFAVSLLCSRYPIDHPSFNLCVDTIGDSKQGYRGSYAVRIPNNHVYCLPSA